MSTDFLFLNTMPKNPSTSLQRGKTGSCATAQLSKSKAADEALEADNRSFVKTLRKASQDQNTAACGSKNCRMNSNDRKKTDPAGEPDKTSDPAAKKDDETSDIRSMPDNVETMGTIQAPFSVNFTAFINMLEKIGLHDLAGGMDFQNKMELSGDPGESSAALLNILNAWLRQSGSFPSSDMTLELGHLRQLIAKALANKTSSPSAENTVKGLPLDQLSKLSEIDHFMKSIYPGEESQRSSSDVRPTDGASGEKSTGPAPILTRLVAELENKFKETGPSKPSEKSDIANQLANRQKGESIKLTTETTTAGAETSDTARKAAALRLVQTDAARHEDNSDIAGKNRASGWSDSPRPNSSAFELGVRRGSESLQENRQLSESAPVPKMTNDANMAKGLDRLPGHGGDSLQENRQLSESAPVPKMTNDANMAKGLDRLPRYDNESVQQNASNSESSPVSKMIKEAQGTRENHLKIGPAISNDVGGKINMVDTGTHYNGLLNSESQVTEKAFENLSAAKETEAGHNSLRTQALDQIVRKAVIQLGNGQHEAKIDLKPDYLGHVRMQVITENQQVTVRILTEFSFVKDLIENNAHQLKSDLQQQGLGVDKLEVSVSHDEKQYKHPKEKADRLNARQHNADQKNTDNSNEDDQLTIEPSRKTSGGESSVDYFA
jgi:flagellar hook-length control protein FliK